MNQTAIEWCRTYAADGSYTEGHTVNPVRFRPHGSARLVTMCQKVSPGCAHCYAEGITRRFWPKDAQAHQDRSLEFRVVNNAPFPGYTALGVSRETGEFVLDEAKLLAVLRYRKPTRIFWGDMTDLFQESVPDAFLDRCFAVCALTPHITHMFLTKRAERMQRYWCADPVGRAIAIDNAVDAYVDAGLDPTDKRWTMPELEDEPLPNVWLGVSAERQEEADARIPLLLQTPAAVRFVSVQPLLGAATYRWAKWDDWGPHPRRAVQKLPVERDGRLLAGVTNELDGLRMLDWVICGGESGAGARPMHPDWARSLRDQCQAAGVPFFFKQWGEWAPLSDHPDAGGSLDNVCFWDEDERRWQKGIQTFATHTVRVGKKAAGHLLDGVEWHQFPEVLQ